MSLLPESLRKRMRTLMPALNKGEGPGNAWEEVFLETDQGLKAEGGPNDVQHSSKQASKQACMHAVTLRARYLM